MTKVTVSLALAGACALVGLFLLWGAEKERRLSAERSLAAMVIVVDETRALSSANAVRAAAQADRNRRLNAELEAVLTSDFGECTDAPLPDDLRDLLERVQQ